MSQENVEIVLQAWEAFDRRDNESVLRLYDPEVEIQVGFMGGEATAALTVFEISFVTGWRPAMSTDRRWRSGSTPGMMWWR